jgi:TRAP-type C4-dicarboxylate transport system permease large subunit
MRPKGGPITDVFAGVMPFLVAYLIAVAIMMMKPELALWLPGLMR